MKILILCYGRIGDMVLVTPAFRMIKEKYPNAIIDVIASRHNIAIPAQNKYVRRVILYNNAPHKLLKALWQIKTTQYDFYIDPKDHYSGTSKMIASIVRAKKKIWLVPDEKRSDAANIDVRDLNPKDYKHFTEKLLIALAPLGIDYNGVLPAPDLFTNSDSGNYVTAFLQQHRVENYVIFNLSSGKKGNESTRSWQKEKWQQLLHAITADGFTVLINAINDERVVAEELATENNKVFVPVSRSIDDAISFVKRSSLVISPDTSLVHISAAFHKPLIALYSNLVWNTEKFYPSNAVKEVLISPREGGPVDEIDPAEVLAAYHRIRQRMA